MPHDFISLTLQRALLERLTGLISTPVGDAVPAGVVALEAMRLIIEVVGEVSSDEVHRMRQPCITKLTAHPQPLQSQVCMHSISAWRPSARHKLCVKQAFLPTQVCLRTAVLLECHVTVRNRDCSSAASEEDNMAQRKH